MRKLVLLFLIALVPLFGKSTEPGHGTSGVDSAPGLSGAEVRKKIDTALKETKKKVDEFKAAHKDSPVIEQLDDHLNALEELNKLFIASHQFLELEKYIVDEQVERTKTAVDHTIASAAIMEAVKGLPGANIEKES